MNFFEEYTEITGKELPDPSKLNTDQKIALAYQLNLSGESVMAIAKYFNCHRSYIYKLLRKAKDEDIAELEMKSYLDMYIEEVKRLEEEIRRYRKVQERIMNGYKVGPDGERVRKDGYIRDFKDIGSLIQKYEHMILDLKVKIGFIPTRNPQELYDKVRDLDPANREKDDTDIKLMNSEEVMAVLLNKMRKKTPTIKENALKELKDQSVI